jgi:hypothetical protein
LPPGTGRNALAEAISQQNEAALSEVLGDNWQHFYPDGIDPTAVDRFQRDWQVKHVIVQQGEKPGSTSVAKHGGCQSPS